MQMYTRTLLTTAIHIYVSLPNFFLGEGASNGYYVNVALLTANFIVRYRSGFSDMIQQL